MTDFSTWQQANLISFCEQSNNRMREQKDCIKTLTYRIDELSAMLDHQRNEAIESERMYLAEFARLRAEIAQARPKRASTLPAPRHGPCNLAAWGILVETDAEFTERAGTQIAWVEE